MAASAQTVSGTEARWGVSASLTPVWSENRTIREDLFGLAGDGKVEGKEFTVGFVRGSTRGGDWGLSFVHKPFKKDITLVESEDECDNGFCSSFNSTRALRDVRIRGVEFHWSKPFVTIKDRVQIGLNIGGGAGFPEGSVEETFTFSSSFTNPVTGQTQTDAFTDTEVRPAKEVLYKVVPLVKFELQAGFILAPGVLVKVAGGLNSPGTGIRLSAVYLIGAQ